MLKLFGIILLVGSLFFIQSQFTSMKIVNKGRIVEMKIIDKPGSCYGTKIKWMMQLEFEGRAYAKQISGLYCNEHQIGDIVKMRYLYGYDKVFFPDEGFVGELIASIFLALVGIAILVYNFKR